MSTGLLVFIFLSLFAIILVALAVGFNMLDAQRRKQVAKTLRTVSMTEDEAVAPVILMAADEEKDPIKRILDRLNLRVRLESKIRQAGLEWPVTQLIMAMAGGAVIGGLIGSRIHIGGFTILVVLAVAALFGAIPLFYLTIKRNKRMAQFEEAFPEALDFLARAMRAGHAFMVSLEMIGEEMPDPLGKEFRTFFNEQNLGATLDTAMENLATRVPLLDVRYFTSAVMLQRQTGGNLSEILNRLSYIIRERFRLKGQVKAVSAHGRMTAGVLLVLPIATALGLMIIAPGYLQSMANDSDGKYLILAAVVLLFVGFYFIRKIINIKV